MRRRTFFVAAILALAGAPLPRTQAQSVATLGVNQIVVLDGARRVTLRYQIAQIIARQRVMGGVMRYLRVPNVSAGQRITNRQPTILLALSSDVQPEASARLIRLDVRNGTREVAFDGRQFAPDHVVPILIEPDPTLHAELPNATAYRVTPQAPLPPGEYVFTGLVGTAFYDFGVD